ncbi:MAG: hypothetical protein QOF37_675 [Thermoleophilaceae bacterium]|nr:hypothetical protein [Thermoleophilaceae bacterium]
MAGVSTPTRLSYGAVAAGIGGIVLILSLFLDWFGPFSAWDFFGITPFVLLLIGIAAVLFAALEAGRVQMTLPVDRVRALTILGIIATTLVWDYIFEGSSQQIGVILAGLGSLGILAGGILAERAPNLSVALGGGPRAGAAPGAAPGYPAQPPAGGPPGGYAQPQAPAAGGATSVGAVQPAPAQQAAPPPQAQPAAQPVQAGPPTGSPPPPGGAADWYPDPRGEKRLRYWDGSQWTRHVAD